jgi:Fe2+ transport system protein FeoA
MALASRTTTQNRPHASATQPEVVTLSALSVRTNARVVQVLADSDDALRLMALGICVGRRIQVFKSGDPLIVGVVGARVGLSARLADGVLVQPLGASECDSVAAAG